MTLLGYSPRIDHCRFWIDADHHLLYILTLRVRLEELSELDVRLLHEVSSLESSVSLLHEVSLLESVSLAKTLKVLGFPKSNRT